MVDAHSATTLRFRPFLAFRSVREYTHENPQANRDYLSMEVIPFIIAFWLMFRGFSSVGYAMDLKRYGTRDWGWYIAFGILAVICSLIILWQPAIGALYAVYMISFAFLIIGFFRIMLSFELKSLHKRGKSMKEENEDKEIPVG